MVDLQIAFHAERKHLPVVKRRDDAPTARRAEVQGTNGIQFPKNHDVRSAERHGNVAVFPESTAKPLNRR